jgi:hypothetical protein
MKITIDVPESTKDSIFEEFLQQIIFTVLNNLRYRLPIAQLYKLNVDRTIRNSATSREALLQIFDKYYAITLRKTAKQIMGDPGTFIGIAGNTTVLNLPGRILALAQEEISSFLLAGPLRELTEIIAKESASGTIPETKS